MAAKMTIAVQVCVTNRCSTTQMLSIYLLIVSEESRNDFSFVFALNRIVLLLGAFKEYSDGTANI